MNLDTFLTIGKQHNICEDYIIQGQDHDYSYIILCDGCSSSKNTDIGARILAHSMKVAMKNIYSMHNMLPFDYDSLGGAAISIAAQTIKNLEIAKTCLDATVIVAVTIKNNIYVYMYGDGSIIRHDSLLNITKYERVSYLNNAPYYLSYLIDYDRRMAYKEAAEALEEKGKTKVTYNGVDTTINEIGQIDSYDSKIIHVYNMDELSFLAISSDGIESFINIHTGEKIPLIYIVKAFTSFKNVNGDFVKRRVKRAIDDLNKNGIVHGDDISFGVIKL